MVQYAVTPWRQHHDLLAVRAQLYSTDDNESLDVTADIAILDQARKRAVDRVHAWKMRGNLPHAVESTALLVDAILHYRQGNAQPSQFAIRAVYTAAFTRFVTGFCDIGRARENRLDPRSMLQIAQQIGMPLHFVALRHEATHEELPSLPRLVATTQEALDWLWNMYWTKLEELADSGEGVRDAGKSASREEARRLLKAFRAARKEALKHKKAQSSDHLAEVDAFCKQFRMLCDTSETRTGIVAGVLVNEKLLFPSSRELGSSMSGAFIMWDDFLRAIDEDRGAFIPAVIRQLLDKLTTTDTLLQPKDDPGSEAYCLWLMHLLNTSAQGVRNDAMRLCCLYPGHWTHRLGQHLLVHGDTSFVEDWQDFFMVSVLDLDEHLKAQLSPDDRGIEYTSTTNASMKNGPNADDSLGGGWRRALLPPQVPIGVVS
ncbi:hypothetical protein BAUCODRAFT_409261 [Baudoinia panamericana UAMH 10762]|uniref:Las1-like protein n=1 Tax=Baudoinia panamericana (strain UAMH 10762) TaxID=717646 RepID=M2NG44_BAUPA|nr:uncharacterized protein BAUCODRAFT_409261 [Baudoinia panamericana UAMH 10762]EMC97960.1 hypothetical protein BAUCODRAFT_409261 [Baudoinia panamericana UAMH 10762]